MCQTEEPCSPDNCASKKPFNFVNALAIIKQKGLTRVTNQTDISTEEKLIQSNLNIQKTQENCLTTNTLKIKNICITDSCKFGAIYNEPSETIGMYCGNHKKAEMVNVVDKTCKNDWCYTKIGKKYEGYCFYCYVHMFPDKPISKNYKTKERAVVDYLTQCFQNVDWITDKIVQDGCSKRRPDLLLDLGYQVVIVEIDENQHIDYDTSCENKRMMELSQDVKHRPIIFIRFNPDDYVDKDETKVTSCWSINGNGMCTIKKNKLKEWNERLNALKLSVEYWLNPENVSEKTIEIVQLFYNENLN